MEKSAVYIEPRMIVRKQSPDLMALDLGVSNAEVDDEAAKQRYDTEFEDKDWGKTDKSLW
jgi:hypothetical protein